ncbi:F-box only protein 28 [Venturia canescens]|uniref:F-box only protein 28 n=1 Tax=Venturia canescens TaxID=32260 RepID=UPI001C9D2FF6|nr:F-box only protein 28 [Venturia canescens]
MLLIIDLPDVVLETILSNLSYDEIAKNRIVCKHFNRTCQKLLNRGFSLMEKHHAQCLRSVKSKLPRRESERRTHPLARHCDALTAIETRISMLSMTFIKYINLHLCCFIPGKVIDEIFRLLRLIRDSKTPPRAYEILQELRDISSMAMEHFDEKILPALKHSMNTSSSTSGVAPYDLPGGSLMLTHHGGSASSYITAHTYNSEKLNKALKKMYNKTKQNKLLFLTAKNRMNKLYLRIKRQSFHMKAQSIKLKQQAKKLNEQDAQLAEMKRHFEDWEQKIVDLNAELTRSREEAQKSDAIDNCKRKCMDIVEPRDNESSQVKQLMAKKRKLIIERKSSSDAKDVKFKKFISELLCTNSTDDFSSNCTKH